MASKVAERALVAMERAGKALEPAGWASKPVGRTLDLAKRAFEPNWRASRLVRRPQN